MDIRHSVVLVTGANRGLGAAFARELLARGASKVYAAARDPATVQLPGVEPLQLDVTDPGQVAAAARQCGDVTLLINNAGIAGTGGFLRDEAEDEARRMLEVNYFGPLRMTRAFAPILARNGGGAILNVLSIASWLHSPLLGVYASSKTAAWALTNVTRQELRAQGTQVVGLHVAFIDTDMTKGFDAPKSSPQAVVAAALDGVQQGASEVMADERTRMIHQGLTASPPLYLHGLPG